MLQAHFCSDVVSVSAVLYSQPKQWFANWSIKWVWNYFFPWRNTSFATLSGKCSFFFIKWGVNSELHYLYCTSTLEVQADFASKWKLTRTKSLTTKAIKSELKNHDNAVCWLLKNKLHMWGKHCIIWCKVLLPYQHLTSLETDFIFVQVSHDKSGI